MGTTMVAAPTRSTTGVAVPLALLSAASFGLSGPLASSLLQIGWTPGAVVLARIGGAFAVLVTPLLLALRRTGLPTRRQARRLVAYGVVAVALAQLCYFNAVQHLSVGVALLLEYLAPVLLIGWQWWRTKARPRAAVLLGAVVAMAGMVGVLDLLNGLHLDPVGVLWGLGAAVCLCAYFVLAESSDAADSTSPLVMTAAGTGIGLFAVLSAGAVGFVPLAVVTSSATLAGVEVGWWVPVALLVGITAVLAYLTGIVAVRRLGSSVASFVALTEVIFAVIFAVVLVGQQPTLGQVVGGVLVLVGITVVQRQSTARGT